MAFTSGLVIVHSSKHHDMLVNGLWNFFQVNHAVDFEIRWDGRSIQAHQLILDVFLSPKQSSHSNGRAAGTSPTLAEQQNKSSMDLIMEFLYNGRVDVPREKLQSLLDVAKELSFGLMTEAVEVAIVNDKADCLFGKDMCSSRPVMRSSYIPLQRVPNSSLDDDDDELDSTPAVPPRKLVASDDEIDKYEKADDGSNDAEIPDTEDGEVKSKPNDQSSGKSYLSPTNNHNRNYYNYNTPKLSSFNQSPQSGVAGYAPPPSLLAFGVSRFPENRGEVSSSAIHGHIYSQQPAFPTFWKPILHDEPEHDEFTPPPPPPPPPMPKPPRRPNNGKRPYKCETCLKVFKRSEHLNNHILTHTKEKPFKCHLCDKAYSQSGTLVVHLRTHSGVKPYKCNICGRAFNQSGFLKIHLLTHTGERPHKCELCGSTFQQKPHLVEHMHSHNAKKKFKCELCQAEFSHMEWSAFNLHKLEHTGKPALVCDICGKSFAGRKNLCAHKRLHRDAGKKLHQCHICGQSFRVKHSMEGHMRLHTGEKPYKCADCDKYFSCDRQLRRHRRGNHNEEQAVVQQRSNHNEEQAVKEVH